MKIIREITRTTVTREGEATVRVFREEQVVKATRSGEVYQVNATFQLDRITVTAGENIGGHRAVVIDEGLAVYADASNVAHAGRIVGITQGAISEGDTGFVQTFGEMEDVSFAWNPGPIFATTNGQLTQTAPASGFVCQVATALTATKIFITVHLPIII